MFTFPYSPLAIILSILTYFINFFFEKNDDQSWSQSQLDVVIKATRPDILSLSFVLST